MNWHYVLFTDMLQHHDLGINSLVMNVVPVRRFNTLPVIYDRDILRVMHDWYSTLFLGPCFYAKKHLIHIEQFTWCVF